MGKRDGKKEELVVCSILARRVMTDVDILLRFCCELQNDGKSFDICL
jgi:hypothetical protein